jgi:hypothetical protein
MFQKSNDWKKPEFALVFSPVPRVMTMMENIDLERLYINKT